MEVVVAATKARKGTQAVACLNSAAAALLGISAPAVAGPPLNLQTDIEYVRYEEEGGKRMTVDGPRISIRAPHGEEAAFTLNLSHESVSGASPAVVTFSSGNKPNITLSGASIQETQNHVDGTYTLYDGDRSWSMGLGHAKENDYRSRFGSLSVARSIDQGNTELTAGIGFSSDDIQSTNDPSLNEKRNTSELSIGASRTISPTRLLQTTLLNRHGRGYFNDPYKNTFCIGCGSVFLPDLRPGERNEWLLTSRLRNHFPESRTTLKAEYRFYHDDWGVNAHTLDLGWIVESGTPWNIEAGVRYHTQSEADFFVGSYTEASRVNQGETVSSDYRLSSYGTLSSLMRLSRKMSDASTLDFNMEHIRQDPSLHFGSTGSLFESMDAWLLSVNLKQEF